jgi:hypothetical protein
MAVWAIQKIHIIKQQNPNVDIYGLALKVRAPIPSIYAGFYTVHYKDIGEFQILYSQDICW